LELVSQLCHYGRRRFWNFIVIMFGLSSHHAELFMAHLISGIIAGIAVATRICVKMKTKQGIRADDVFILLTLLFYYGAIATVLQSKSLGSQMTDVH
jgi:hypothetical protein